MELWPRCATILLAAATFLPATAHADGMVDTVAATAYGQNIDHSAPFSFLPHLLLPALPDSVDARTKQVLTAIMQYDVQCVRVGDIGHPECYDVLTPICGPDSGWNMNGTVVCHPGTAMDAICLVWEQVGWNTGPMLAAAQKTHVDPLHNEIAVLFGVGQDRFGAPTPGLWHVWLSGGQPDGACYA